MLFSIMNLMDGEFNANLFPHKQYGTKVKLAPLSDNKRRPKNPHSRNCGTLPTFIKGRKFFCPEKGDAAKRAKGFPTKHA